MPDNTFSRGKVRDKLEASFKFLLLTSDRHVGITMVTRSGKMLHRILVTTVMACVDPSTEHNSHH